MAARSDFSIEGAHIIFSNFAGKERPPYNPAGKRNFTLLLDDHPELVEQLIEDGWNIKYLKPRDENDVERPIIDVAVQYSEKARPPKVVLITDRNKTELGENEIGMLDWAEIKNADVVVRPYNYNVNGREGVKAYLKALYVTIVEDKFDEKYADLPFSD